MGYREGHRGTGEVPPAEAGTHLQLLSPIRTLPCRSTERGGGAQVPAHAASERSRCPPPHLMHLVEEHANPRCPVCRTRTPAVPSCLLLRSRCPGLPGNWRKGGKGFSRMCCESLPDFQRLGLLTGPFCCVPVGSALLLLEGGL